MFIEVLEENRIKYKKNLTEIERKKKMKKLAYKFPFSSKTKRFGFASQQ